MVRIREFLEAFKKGETGQGLAEYCLITAALALMGLGLYLHACGGIGAIFSQK
jgi:hypothetical protein